MVQSGGGAAQDEPPAEDTKRWMALYPQLAMFFGEVRRQTSLSATELAVLFALGTTGSTAVSVLREWLTADAGHLSRVLARFEREGMVTRVCSGTDHRRQQVTLTALGIQRRAALGVIVAEAARTHSPLGRSPLDDSGRSPATSIRVNPA